MKKLLSLFASVLVLGIFIVMSTATSEEPMTEEELQAEAMTTEAELDTLLQHIETMGEAYNLIYDYMSADSVVEYPMCDEVTVDAAQYNYLMGLSTIYFDFMERYTTTDSLVWDEFLYKWEWLNTVHAGDNYRYFPSENDDDIEISIRYGKLNDLINERYLIVILAGNPANNNMPRVGSDDSFISGNFDGLAFLVDLQEMKLDCINGLSVTSSDEVSWVVLDNAVGRMLSKDEKEALKDDFREQMEDELQTIFPDINVNTTGFL